MTTGPENPYGDQPPPQPDQQPGQPQGQQPPNPYYPQQPQQPAPPPYGQQQPYQQPYTQQPYAQPYQQPYGGQYPQPYHQPPPSDGLGIAAMVIGIASLVLMCGYGVGLLGSPAALIMGRISMKRIDRSEGRLGGRGFAQAGFILGIVGTVLLLLAIIAVVVLIIVAANGGFDGPTYEYDY